MVVAYIPGSYRRRPVPITMKPVNLIQHQKDWSASHQTIAPRLDSHEVNPMMDNKARENHTAGNLHYPRENNNYLKKHNDFNE